MGRIIQVQNASAIAVALAAQIAEWPYMMAEETIVERAAVINKSQDRCPWVGIYRQQQVFEPRTLGFGTGYRRQNITFALVLQEASSVSGEECEQRMESLVTETVSAICSDESIRGSCEALGADAFVLTYSSYQAESNSFYQEAVLTFTVVTNPIVKEA